MNVNTKPQRYETDRMFAQYLEAEWGDIKKMFNGDTGASESGLFPFGNRTLPFYDKVAEVIASTATKSARYIDVGGALGRLCFELANRRPDLSIHHFDTSSRFSSFLSDFIEGRTDDWSTASQCLLPDLDFEGLKEAIEAARINVLHQKPEPLGQFDFVSCCNVFDRVENQQKFLASLLGLVAEAGHVLLTTPYDFDRTSAGPHFSIEDLLPSAFTIQHEENVDYVQRANPRKIVQYKAQLLVLKRVEAG